MAGGLWSTVGSIAGGIIGGVAGGPAGALAGAAIGGGIGAGADAAMGGPLSGQPRAQITTSHPNPDMGLSGPSGPGGGFHLSNTPEIKVTPMQNAFASPNSGAGAVVAAFMSSTKKKSAEAAENYASQARDPAAIKASQEAIAYKPGKQIYDDMGNRLADEVKAPSPATPAPIPMHSTEPSIEEFYHDRERER